VQEVLARLRRGEFTGGEPIDHVVLLLQEVTRHGDGVPRAVPRGAPVPARIAPRHASGEADVQRFADEGYAVLYVPSMRNGDGQEDRGNAIVSTLPLADARAIELPLERQRRVVAAAAIEARDDSEVRWRLDVVNVHLDTALALAHGGPGAARGREVAAFLSALGAPERSADAATATVVAGDLNTWMGDREQAVRELSRMFPQTPPADRAPTWRGPLGLRATLDHVFVGGRVSADRVTRLPSRFGSDHYPLLTVVRFRLH